MVATCVVHNRDGITRAALEKAPVGDASPFPQADRSGSHPQPGDATRIPPGCHVSGEPEYRAAWAGQEWSGPLRPHGEPC